jgi:anti-anti-sigma factor
MKVKVDTKEKFHVITIQEPVLAANMTEAVSKLLLWHLTLHIKNVILNLEEVDEMSEGVAVRLAQIQQKFYESDCSFVICNLKPDIEDFLDKKELLEVMNVVPTESEAWDIVQMEEIERELNQNDD